MEAPLSKTDFILSHPETLPAAEVVELAEKAGMECSLQSVYTARSAARKRKAKKKATKAQKAVKSVTAGVSVKRFKRAKAPPRATRAASVPSTEEHMLKRNDQEAVFRTMVVNIGLTRVRAILDEVADHAASF